jgi:signal peptidase I
VNEQPAGRPDAAMTEPSAAGIEGGSASSQTSQTDGLQPPMSSPDPTHDQGPIPESGEVVASPPRSTGRELLSSLREILETLVLAALFFFALRAVVQNFRVEGSSMFPTFADGQYVLVNKAVYAHLSPASLPRWMPGSGSAPARFLFHPPRRGDVIVFHPPPPNDPSRDFIKRVIGVPGDTVDIKENRVAINDQVLAEPYIRQPTLPLSTRFAHVVLGPDQYFVLGDNRGNSSDSRAWGPIGVDAIVGRTWLVYWPLSAWKIAPNHAENVPGPAPASP